MTVSRLRTGKYSLSKRGIHMTKRTMILSLRLCLALAASADTPKTAARKTMTVTATVEAIDYTARELTLKGPSGNEMMFQIPNEVTRFQSIRVGDVVTAKYEESVVVAIKQPGAKSATGEEVVTKHAGDKPGATVSRQIDADVTVKSIDPKIPSITVTTSDARVLSFRVEDPKRLKNVKVGDVITITYTEALILTVDAPK